MCSRDGRPDPRTPLPADVVEAELARSSGADRVASGEGVMLWAIVDRVPAADGRLRRDVHGSR